MGKSLKLILAMCVCAFMALGVAGCACSTEVSRSSDEDLVVEQEEEVIATDPVYVLAVGNDSRYRTAEDKGVSPDDPSYGDTIMVLRVDPGANVISILSVPRDTAAEYNGEPVKINAVHHEGGPEALAAAVGEMLDVDVPYYFDMGFVDFADFIDEMGGVTVDVPMALTGGDIISGERISLDEGTSTLDGASALMLARQRKVYAYEGEAVRQMISRQMVSSVIQAVANQPTSEAGGYARVLKSFSETNMSGEMLEAYIAAFMENDGEITFHLGTTPYVGGIDETGTWRIANDPEVYALLHDALENATALDVVESPAVY